MIPSVAPNYTQKHLGLALTKFLKGNINDNITKEFEEKFAKKINSKYAISFPYGRAGLFAFLKSQNIENSHIILPAYQCLVVPNSILQSSNRPIFVDNLPNQVNANLEQLTKLFDQKTKAVIATHMHGFSVDIERIRDELPKDVFLIEDSCLAIFSSFDGKQTGNKGDISFYSFNNTKQITTNDGGMVVTNNEEIAEKLIETRKKLFKKPSNSDSIINLFKTFLTNNVYEHKKLFDLAYYLWEHYDFMKKFTKPAEINETDVPTDFLASFGKIKAYIGLIQLEELESMINKRKKIAKRYYETLEKIDNLNYQEYDKGSTYGHFPVWSKHRPKLKLELKKMGIMTGHSFDYSCPQTPAYKKMNNEKEFPESKKIADGVFNLPMYSNLSDENVEYVCDCLEKICQRI